MEFTIKREPFLRELALMREVAATNTVQPILACTRIEAEDGELFLMASDSNVSLSSICGTDSGLVIEKDGVAAVDAKRLHSYIGGMESAEVTCTVDETGWLQIWYPDRRDGKPLYRMPGFPVDGFPKIPEVPEAGDWKTGDMPAPSFVRMVSSVDYAVPGKSESYALPGVMLRFDKDAIRMIATDTHRLLIALRQGGTEDPWEVLIPKKGLAAITALCRSLQLGGRVAFTRGPNHVFADAGGRTVASTLLAGEFPPWTAIIKNLRTVKFAALDTKKFKASASRVAAVQDEKGIGGIQLIFSASGILRFSAQNSLFGEADEWMDIGYKLDEKLAANMADKDLAVRVNHHYLLDFLSAAQAEVMKVAGSDSLQPIKLIDGDLATDGFQTDCVLMVINPHVIAQEAERTKAAKEPVKEEAAAPAEDAKPRGARKSRAKKNA